MARKRSRRRKAGERLDGLQSYWDDKGGLITSLAAPVAATPLIGSIVDTVSEEDNDNALIEAAGQTAGGLAGGGIGSFLTSALVPKKFKLLAKLLPSVGFALGSIPGENVGGSIATGLFGEEPKSDAVKAAEEEVAAYNILEPSLEEKARKLEAREERAAIAAAKIKQQAAYNTALLEQATAGIDPEFVKILGTVGALYS